MKEEEKFLEKIEQLEEEVVAKNKDDLEKLGKKHDDQRALDQSSGENLNNSKKKKFSGIAVFATTFLLFLIFVVLLIFVLSFGGAGNPVLKFFGQNEDSVKDFLLSVVNGSFGFLSVILLLAITITIFFGFSQKNNLKKSANFVFAGISFGLLLFNILVWLGMFKFVDALAVSPGSEGGKIIMIPADTSDLVAPVEIEFSAKNIEQEITTRGMKIIQGFSWNFGDEFLPKVRDQKVTHFFTKDGFHEVKLKVFFHDDTFIEKSISFEIPRATFEINPIKPKALAKIQFDATLISESLPGVKSYEWDFDNDLIYEKSTNQPKIAQILEKIGTYKINLRILDQNNNLHNFFREIEISEISRDDIFAKIRTSPPADPMTGFLQAQVLQEIQFDASKSESENDTISEFLWDFGDGTEKKGKKVSKSFEKQGEFEVVLTIKDNEGNYQEASMVVSTIPEKSSPVPIVRTIPKMNGNKLSANVSEKILFDASNSADSDNNIINFEWDLDGDGDFEKSGSEIEKVFRETGEFEVVLRVTDADANFDILKIPVEIKQKSLIAKIETNKETAEMPCEIEFDGSFSVCNLEDCDISAYKWDFGDDTGEQIAGAHIPHLFSDLGEFEVQLSVVSNLGEVDSVTKKVFCRQTPLVSCFSVSRDKGKAPVEIDFDSSCTTGMPQKWSWDFGDGIISKQPSPSHTFEKSGEYSVTLTVVDEKQNISKRSMKIFAE